MAWLAPFGAGLVFSALMVVAFPAPSWWGAALVALLPLLAVALIHVRGQWGRAGQGASRFRRTWCALRTPVLVSIGVLPFQLYEHQFIINISALGFVPLAAAMSLLVGLFVGLLAYTKARLPWLPLTILAPVLWTGVEVVRSEFIGSGYSWVLVSYPLIDAPVAPVVASLVGVYGVSFLMAMLAGIVADVALSDQRRPASAIGGIAAIAVICIAAYAARPVQDANAKRLRIAVIQTNIPQDNKMDWELSQRVQDFNRFLELTGQAAEGKPKPDLIAWPETMFPGAFLDPGAINAVHEAEAKMGKKFEGLTYFAEKLASEQKRLGVPMIVGAAGFDRARLVETAKGLDVEDDGRFNSAFLIKDGLVDPLRYDKLALTPFGEVMPGFRYWPWLQKQVLALAASGMAFDLTPGMKTRVFDAEPGNIAVVTPICFESTKPGVCRRLINAAGGRATIVLNLTNDGWFGGFNPAREQHLQIARWRAAELGVSVMRAANTGISAVIDPAGRVLRRGIDGSSAAWHVDGTLTADITAVVPGTIYSRTGDVLGWSTVAGSGILLLLACVRGQRAKASAA